VDGRRRLGTSTLGTLRRRRRRRRRSGCVEGSIAILVVLISQGTRSRLEKHRDGMQVVAPMLLRDVACDSTLKDVRKVNRTTSKPRCKVHDTAVACFWLQ
jgi:hypothetical protein